MASVAFSGPLPPPEILKKYDEIIPNGAERLMRMAEREQEMEHEKIRKDLIYRAWGLFLGFFSFLAIIGLLSYAIWRDAPWPSIVALAAIVIVIVVMIGGSERAPEIMKHFRKNSHDDVPTENPPSDRS